MQNIRAEIILPTTDLRGDISFFTKDLGFRMDEIFPADDPQVAVLSGYGIQMRLDRDAGGSPGTIRILGDDPILIANGKTELTAPGGTFVKIDQLHPPFVQPPTKHEFVVRRLADKQAWVVGRADMEYRDLIPSRLGGSIIASHIRIPGGGPVPDMVHYHSVGFQLIFCYKGWVDLVYEDQGDPFRLHAGNCVIQPPEIRHRVLYASDNLEVIEIGVPAEHVTTIDHDMELPTAALAPDRMWNGQRFVHFKSDAVNWKRHARPGFVAKDTTIAQNTQGTANVCVLRPDGDPDWADHGADIHFSFVLSGTMVLSGPEQTPKELGEGDAFVIPPGVKTLYSDTSPDLRLLEVTLPG